MSQETSNSLVPHRPLLSRRPPRPLRFSGLRGLDDGFGQTTETGAVAAVDWLLAYRAAQLGRRRPRHAADRLRDRRRELR